MVTLHAISDIPTINRYAIILDPAEGYFDWTKACPEPDPKLTLVELQIESTVFLVPETNTEPENWLKRNCKPILEHELEAWYTDENYWPEKLTYKLFKEFFNIRVSSMVMDLGKETVE
jgi:hypothetical protein